MYRMVICRGEEWRQRGREADCVVRQVRDAGVLRAGLGHGKKGSASRDTVMGKTTPKFANPAIGMVPGQNF